jgi:hypothetical protein
VALKSDPALRPGAFARGSVLVNKAERPVLPQTAVMSDSAGAYVYIVNDKSRVERRPITVAGTIDSGIIIASGLTGNERIVMTAGGFLRDGEQVTIAGSSPGPTTAKDART